MVLTKLPDTATDHRAFAQYPTLAKFRPASEFAAQSVPAGLVCGAWLFEFPSGIKVSVAREHGMYGSERGLFEAYLYAPNDEQLYDCFLGAGPTGWLTAVDVVILLNYVWQMTPEGELPADVEARADVWLASVIASEGLL